MSSLAFPFNFNCFFVSTRKSAACDCVFPFGTSTVFFVYLLWRWGVLKFNKWVAAAGLPVLGAWVRKDLLRELTTEIKTGYIVIKSWVKIL